jgi:HSP20 family protein
MYDALSDGVETLRGGGSGVYPSLNLREDAENLYLSAELPGVAPEDIELSVQGDSLTLRGERRILEADKKLNYHRRERDAGYFRRVINLPVRVDSGQVQATVRNGLLMVTMPKAAEAKAHQITIKAE